MVYEDFLKKKGDKCPFCSRTYHLLGSFYADECENCGELVVGNAVYCSNCGFPHCFEKQEN